MGTTAALQFSTSLSGYPLVSDLLPEPLLFEFDRSQNLLRHEIQKTPFDPAGGTSDALSEPGLGVTVDEEAGERFRLA